MGRLGPETADPFLKELGAAAAREKVCHRRGAG